VVPSAPFVGEPAPRHRERPHQPRDQKPVEHQTLDEPRFNEEDAPQDTTTGDAAGVLPQEAGGPRHAQDVHRDRCTQPLLEHERGEATTATVRPKDVPTRLIDQKRDGDLEIPNAEQHPQQEPAERSDQPQPEPECFEPKKPPAEPAERSGHAEPEPERFEPEMPPREQPPDAERRHQLRLPLPQQDSAVQNRQQRPPEPGARSKPLRRPPEAG
jgi:hypothetical protein